MIRFLPFLFAFAMIVMPLDAPAQEAPRAGTYQIEQQHAFLMVRVGHLGVSRTMARFNAISGTLVLDPAAPENSRLTASVEAASVDTGMDGFDNFLRGPTFLNAAANPQITFESTRVERTGANTARVTGNLTINGRTNPATFDVVFNGATTNPFENKYVAGFSATARISRAQWGLTAFAQAVGDEVEILIEAEFSLPR